MYVRPQTQPSHEEKRYGELLGLTHTFATTFYAKSLKKGTCTDTRVEVKEI